MRDEAVYLKSGKTMERLIVTVRRYRRGVIGSICLVSLPSAAQAQPPQVAPTGRSARYAEVAVTAQPITVDGMLDEGVWRSAATIGDLVQRQPEPGGSPSERTEVRLLRDEMNLYIGVIAFDSNTGAIVASQMARDGDIDSDDRIEILLDTFRDQRSAFYFATNPAGALVDGLAFSNELNTDWDTSWEVRTRRTDLGWTAEFAIPFKSLSFPDDGRVWGFNVARTIQRKLEDARWSGARLQTQFLQVSEAGQIGTFEGLSQGIGLEIRPFLSGTSVRLAGTGNEMSAEPGLDLSYRITPSLRMIGTVNTDFGETEVDARQINLSRFSLFFPEQRTFFLEDAGVFSFASTGPGTPGGIPSAGADVYPFFSRRIGLQDGQEVPIDFGGKIAGRLGSTEMGILGVRTGAVEGLTDAASLLVGRIKWNLLEQSYVGLIFTAGDAASAQSGRTYGADVRLATSNFLGRSRNLDVTAYVTRSDREDVTGRDWSWGMSARYPNDRFDAQVAVREIQENFDPALGFVQRAGVRMLRVGGSYNPRPADFLGIQQMFHDVYYTHFTRLEDGQVESWNLHVTPIDWHFKSGDNLHSGLDFNLVSERLFEPFEISPGVVLPVGEYRFTRFQTFFMSAARRRLSGQLSLGWGSYWSGHAEEIEAGITYRVPPNLTVSLESAQTFAHLPQGDFTARIYAMDASLSVSPALSFFNLVQYDNLSRNLGWQGRLRWTLRPGSDFFASFQQGWIRGSDPGDRRFRTGDQKTSVKIQYSIRF